MIEGLMTNEELILFNGLRSEHIRTTKVQVEERRPTAREVDFGARSPAIEMTEKERKEDGESPGRWDKLKALEEGIVSRFKIRYERGAPPHDRVFDGIGGTVEEYEKDQRYWQIALKRERPKRFIAAILGGLAFVTPMLIMAIHLSLEKNPITSSVAVIAFALAVAWKSTAQMETLLATTAAYAAVMVVFVGVNGQG